MLPNRMPKYDVDVRVKSLELNPSALLPTYFGKEMRSIACRKCVKAFDFTLWVEEEVVTTSENSGSLPVMGNEKRVTALMGCGLSGVQFANSFTWI